MWYRRIIESNDDDPPPSVTQVPLREFQEEVAVSGQTSISKVIHGPEFPRNLSASKKRKREDIQNDDITRFKRVRVLSKKKRVRRMKHISGSGRHETSTAYKKVAVLLLRWGDNIDDLGTRVEVESLKATFEDRFNYHVEIKNLELSSRKSLSSLEVRVNGLVAKFVDDHDGPSSLLVVYYAGHGRPGTQYGDLELFRYVAHGDYITQLLTVAGNQVPQDTRISVRGLETTVLADFLVGLM